MSDSTSGKRKTLKNENSITYEVDNVRTCTESKTHCDYVPMCSKNIFNFPRFILIELFPSTTLLGAEKHSIMASYFPFDRLTGNKN